MSEFELRRIPINRDNIAVATDALEWFDVRLDQELILDKNKQYGDSWQAEGPFLAASRMKDKITRVSNLIEGHEISGAALVTADEGFQDVLEMMAYGKLLMLYWVYNRFGLGGTTLASVRGVYEFMERELVEAVDSHVPDATG